MIALPLAVKVALGAGLLGATAGVVGVYAVLRRRALLGDVLAHAALPGVCLAFLVAGVREAGPLALGALATGLASVFCVAQIRRWTRTREDAALGVVLSTFFGAGVLLLSVIQKSGGGAQAGLDSYLFGEVASLTSRDIGQLAVAALVALVAVVLLHKELKLFAFDEGFARAQGWPVVWLDFAVMASVAAVVVLGLPVCGVVLIAAMLIFPAATARYWTDRLSRLVALAGLFGALAGGLGVLVASPAFAHALPAVLRGPSLPPPGPTIVLTAAVLFVLSLCFAPQRGLVAAGVRQGRLRRRVRREHLLRGLYEATEAHGPADRVVSDTELGARYGDPPSVAQPTIAAAERDGFVDRSAGGVRLTARGLADARRVTRTHRLWELYLVRYASIAVDHVDRDADDVEHLLPPELVDRLEAELVARGDGVPASPHELGA
ncbi:MAG: iron chelate uptake ABC transporter family permease subunit [Lacipirellulaceae bacterium]